MSSTEKNKAAKSSGAAHAKTVSVSLRVRRDHITELDKIAEAKGIMRSAAIQIAIAEFIERGGK